MINETLNNASCILRKKKEAKISVMELLKTVGRRTEVVRLIRIFWFGCLRDISNLTYTKWKACDFFFFHSKPIIR